MKQTLKFTRCGTEKHYLLQKYTDKAVARWARERIFQWPRLGTLIGFDGQLKPTLLGGNQLTRCYYDFL